MQNPGTTDITINAVYQLGVGQGANVAKAYTVGAGERATVLAVRKWGRRRTSPSSSHRSPTFWPNAPCTSTTRRCGRAATA